MQHWEVKDPERVQKPRKDQPTYSLTESAEEKWITKHLLRRCGQEAHREDQDYGEVLRDCGIMRIRPRFKALGPGPVKTEVDGRGWADSQFWGGGQFGRFLKRLWGAEERGKEDVLQGQVMEDE